MAAYDYRCANEACPYEGFTVECSIHEKKDHYDCPACGSSDTVRVYYPLMHTWHFRTPQETRGVHKAEEALKRAYNEANEIADNQYLARAEQGTKKWVESGKKDELLAELAEQDFVKNPRPKIVSGPGGITGSEATVNHAPQPAQKAPAQ